MKLVKLRMTTQVIVVNEADWPVRHRYQVPSLDFSLEIRMNEQGSAYVNGVVTRDGVTRYAGRGSLRGYSEFALYNAVTEEVFNVADALNISADYIWPFIDQLPAFSEGGVKISDAEAYEDPIRDLLARGASPREVVDSLGICPNLYEFVTGTEIPPLAMPPEDMNRAVATEDEPVW